MARVEFYLSLDREIDIWEVTILGVRYSTPLEALAPITANIKVIAPNLKEDCFYEAELKPCYEKDAYSDNIFDGYQVSRVREVGVGEWIEV